MKQESVIAIDRNFKYIFLLAFSFLIIIPLCLNSVFVATDLGQFYLPLYKIYSNSLQGGGGIPFWYTDIFNGYYMHAEGQLGMLHPANYFPFKFLPFAVAFNLTRILPFFAAFYGMAFFCESYDDLRPVKYFTSLVFAFNTFFLNHFVHTNMIFSLAHLPFLLYFSKKMGWRQGSIKYIVFNSLLWGSVFLLGHPQSAMIIFFICGIYSVVVCDKGWLGLLTETVFTFCMGLFVAAVQILPTIDLFFASARHSAAPGFATTWSLHPANIIQVVYPFLFKQFYPEYGTYVTILVLTLAAYSLRNKIYDRLDKLRVFALVMLIAGLILAFGKYFYLGWLLNHMPFFRVPARWYFCSLFGAVLLAGAGWKHVLEKDSAPELFRVYRFLAGTALLLAVFIYVFNNIVQVVPLTSYWMLSALVFVPILVYSASRQMAFIKLLLMVFVFELVAYGYHTRNFEVKRIDEYSKSVPGVELFLRDAEKNQKVETSDNRMTLFGLRISKGYVGLMPESKWVNGIPPGVNWSFITRKGWIMVRQGVEYAWRIDSAGHFNSLPSTLLHFNKFGGNKVEFETVFSYETKLLLDVTYHQGWKAWIDGRPHAVEKWENGLLAINVPPGTLQCSLKFMPDSLRFGFIITVTFLLLAFAIIVADLCYWKKQLN